MNQYFQPALQQGQVVIIKKSGCLGNGSSQETNPSTSTVNPNDILSTMNQYFSGGQGDHLPTQRTRRPPKQTANPSNRNIRRQKTPKTETTTTTKDATSHEEKNNGGNSNQNDNSNRTDTNILTKRKRETNSKENKEGFLKKIVPAVEAVGQAVKTTGKVIASATTDGIAEYFKQSILRNSVAQPPVDPIASQYRDPLTSNNPLSTFRDPIFDSLSPLGQHYYTDPQPNYSQFQSNFTQQYPSTNFSHSFTESDPYPEQTQQNPIVMDNSGVTTTTSDFDPISMEGWQYTAKDGETIILELDRLKTEAQELKIQFNNNDDAIHISGTIESLDNLTRHCLKNGNIDGASDFINLANVLLDAGKKHIAVHIAVEEWLNNGVNDLESAGRILSIAGAAGKEVWNAAQGCSDMSMSFLDLSTRFLDDPYGTAAIISQGIEDKAVFVITKAFTGLRHVAVMETLRENRDLQGLLDYQEQFQPQVDAFKRYIKDLNPEKVVGTAAYFFASYFLFKNLGTAMVVATGGPQAAALLSEIGNETANLASDFANKIKSSPQLSGVARGALGGTIETVSLKGGVGAAQKSLNILENNPGLIQSEGSLAKAIETVSEVGNGTVWNSIKMTDQMYNGTRIPKSFEIFTRRQKFWVHPNATKHMKEYLTEAIATTHSMPINSQAILTSFKAAMEEAIVKGFEYDKIFTIGCWEFKIGKARQQGLLPSIYHAMFNPKGFH